MNAKLNAVPRFTLPSKQPDAQPVTAYCYTLPHRSQKRDQTQFVMYTKEQHWHCPSQLTTHPVSVLRNGIRISSDVWWLFVHLCGIDSVDAMMAEPEFE